MPFPKRASRLVQTRARVRTASSGPPPPPVIYAHTVASAALRRISLPIPSPEMNAWGDTDAPELAGRGPQLTFCSGQGSLARCCTEETTPCLAEEVLCDGEQPHKGGGPLSAPGLVLESADFLSPPGLLSESRAGAAASKRGAPRAGAWPALGSLGRPVVICVCALLLRLGAFSDPPGTRSAPPPLAPFPFPEASGPLPNRPSWARQASARPAFPWMGVSSSDP